MRGYLQLKLDAEKHFMNGSHLILHGKMTGILKIWIGMHRFVNDSGDLQ